MTEYTIFKKKRARSKCNFDLFFNFLRLGATGVSIVTFFLDDLELKGFF